MTEDVEMDATPASVVADRIVEGIENGTEAIFPAAMAEQIGPVYLSSPKTLEP